MVSGVFFLQQRRRSKDWRRRMSRMILPPALSLLSIHHTPASTGTAKPVSFPFSPQPINNLICCHMIMLRPAVQLPNQPKKHRYCRPAANEIFKGQLTARTKDSWHHTNGSRSLSTDCAGLKKKKKGEGRKKKKIYTLKLIHWHNNRTAQLLFCSVSFHSSAGRYGRGRGKGGGVGGGGGLLEVETRWVGSHCVSTSTRLQAGLDGSGGYADLSSANQMQHPLQPGLIIESLIYQWVKTAGRKVEQTIEKTSGWWKVCGFC